MPNSRKSSPPVYPMVIVAIISFWLGYQSCVFNVEMSGDTGTPFSPYTRVDHSSSHFDDLAR